LVGESFDTCGVGLLEPPSVLTSAILHDQGRTDLHPWCSGPIIKDPTHNIDVVAAIEEPIRKRYLPVEVVLLNTSTTANLDCDPSEITFTAE
jgi:hypothetical protein